ncbi:MAG: hypothetical protein IPK26_07360 [Planctomycetes bacterium]|nr:hypothetical protein [Planctomycetota bacterium]
MINILPAAVVPDYRRQGPYLSALLSRHEVSGRNEWNRRLFQRRRHGRYYFNPGLSVRVGGGGAEARWAPLTGLLGEPTRQFALAAVREMFGQQGN